MNTDLLLVLIGLIVIAIIGAAVVAYIVKRSGNKKEAIKFLEGLSDKLLSMVLKAIRSFNPKDIPSDITEIDVERVETIILQKIYDTCWKYVEEIVKEKDEEDSDFFTKAVLSFLLNRKFIENFIKNLIENTDSATKKLHSKAEAIESGVTNDRIKEMEEREQELTEEFSNQEKYVEKSNEDELPVGEDEELTTPSKEEASKLNPQKDEAEDLDPDNDISVEVLDETEDIYYDKSGRARSKRTGRWTKDPRK